MSYFLSFSEALTLAPIILAFLDPIISCYLSQISHTLRTLPFFRNAKAWKERVCNQHTSRNFAPQNRYQALILRKLDTMEMTGRQNSGGFIQNLLSAKAAHVLWLQFQYQHGFPDLDYQAHQTEHLGQAENDCLQERPGRSPPTNGSL